ncbi:MAG: hypothetical protein HQ503_08840 [Rhodospirillales bacterium]|nr:hypothetical protein [Rhodospirillales bacterium]
MIIAPEGYERFPILVNPLLVPDMSAAAGRSQQATVEPVVEFHRLDLDSRLKLVSEYKHQGSHGKTRSDGPGQETRMINPDLIAGTAASSESIVILAAGNQVSLPLPQAAAAYESVSAQPIGRATNWIV